MAGLQHEDEHTVYVDNVGTTSVKDDASLTLVLGKGDPYTGDKISDLVSRSYRVGSFAWAHDDAHGAKIYTLTLPEAFLNFPFIYDRLKNYRYFRCKAKVSLRMNTTRYQYGSLMVSYLPFYDPTATRAFRHLTVAQAAQNNGMIFSANAGNTLEFEVPFVSPLTWWDTTTCGDANFVGQLGSVFVHVINPLKSASPTPPEKVDISVFIQMVDAEVAGLLPATAPPVEIVMPQSMPANMVEAKKKVQEGVLVGVAKAMNTISPVLSDVVSTAASVGRLLGLGLDKPSTVAVATPVYHDVDADFLYGSGIDYSHKLTFSPAAQAAKSAELMGTNPNPSLLETMMKPYFYKRYSFDETALADSKVFEIIMCPGMTTTTISGVYNIYNVSPLAWYASQFNYYRGGMKVLLHFNTSLFTTARVRISHVQNDTFNFSALTDYSGDFTSRVVDICGDTFVSFVVPYLDPKTFMKFDWALPPDTPTDHLGVVALSIVNPISVPDMSVNPTVDISVYISAAEDFEVAQFTGERGHPGAPWEPVYANTIPTVEEVSPQTSLGQVFAKPFEGLTPATLTRQRGMITQEPELSITDIGKRYFGWTAGEFAAVLPQAPAADYHEYLSAPFLFTRGSMRVKWMNNSNALTSVASYALNGDNIGASDPYKIGSVFAGTAFNKPVGSVEVPFFQSYPFFEFANTHALVQQTACIQMPYYSSNEFTYRAFGDDFALGYQAATPIMKQLIAPVETKGRVVKTRKA